jgi:hypothetical protein
MKIFTSTLAAVLLCSSVASAEDAPESGCFGLGDYVILSLQGAGLTTDTVGPGAPDPMTNAVTTEDQQLEGNFGLFRFTIGGYMRATRFRSLVGGELTMGFGWLGTSAVTNQGSAGLEGMTWGRYFFDMDAGLTLMILERFGLMGFFDARLSVQGGVGFNNDMSYLYTGGRLATSLFFGLEGEASYQYRWGNSYADGDATEHRVAASLIVPNAKKDGSWALTAEVWRGDQRKTAMDTATMTELVVATPGRAFKGEYTAVLLGASIRWR